MQLLGYARAGMVTMVMALMLTWVSAQTTTTTGQVYQVLVGYQPDYIQGSIINTGYYQSSNNKDNNNNNYNKDNNNNNYNYNNNGDGNINGNVGDGNVNGGVSVGDTGAGGYVGDGVGGGASADGVGVSGSVGDGGVSAHVSVRHDVRWEAYQYLWPRNPNDLQNWRFLSYFPDQLTITEGDSVNFVHNMREYSTVVFGPVQPLFIISDGGVTLSDAVGTANGLSVSADTDTLSSGLLGNGTNSWLVSFPTAGVYSYYDILHYPPMEGTIYVVAPTDTKVDDKAATAAIPVPAPSDYDAQVQQTLELVTSLVPKVEMVQGVHNNVPASRRSDSDDSRIWTARYVGDYYSRASLFKLIPSEFTIRQGDTVEFVNADISKHNVLVNQSGNFYLNDDNGYLNQNIVQPQNSPHYYGGTASTGIMMPIFVPNTIYSWNVTFHEPGDYPYIDGLHEMIRGVIHVQPLGNHHYDQQPYYVYSSASALAPHDVFAEVWSTVKSWF